MDVTEYCTREPGRFEAYDAVLAAAQDLAHQMEPPENPLECEFYNDSAPDAERRRAALATLHALAVLRRGLDEAQEQVAWTAGQTGATYADIGAATGITRQAARTRWPDVVPNARPGRPPLPATATATATTEES